MASLLQTVQLFNKDYKRFIIVFWGYITVCILACIFAWQYMYSLIEITFTINGGTITLTIISSFIAYKALKNIDNDFGSFLRLRSDFNRGIPCNEKKFSLLFLVAKTCNTIVAKKGKLVITSTAEKNLLSLLLKKILNLVFFILDFYRQAVFLWDCLVHFWD